MTEPLRTSDTEAAPPLAVDLDGTLVECDTLIESLLLLVKRDPIALLSIPGWLLGGKAAFKRKVTDRVSIDVAQLPYDERLLERLRQERATRRLILCTAADQRIADRVAQHLGIFDEVLATGGDRNLSSVTKAALLVERYGTRGFDYVANDVVDLPVFQAARQSWVVNATPALERVAHTMGNVDWTLPRREHGSSGWWRALRPHQWVKNLLVFVPLLATVDPSHLEALIPATLAFISFSLVASSVYVLNDLMDLPDDRRHPRKRKRPIAAGAISVPQAMLLGTLSLAAGVAAGAFISPLFLMVLLLYLVATTLYTVLFKRIPLLDTLVLSGLYTMRILAGAAAIRVVPSVWLLAFSMFFFLSLALAKRHSELLEVAGTQSGGWIPGREYRPDDLQVLISQGSASGYSAVLVLALYINSDTVRSQYQYPEFIWLICPLLIYWINKLWLSSQRQQIRDDPIIWAMTNRVSRLIAALTVLLLVLARLLPRVIPRPE